MYWRYCKKIVSLLELDVLGSKVQHRVLTGPRSWAPELQSLACSDSRRNEGRRNIDLSPLFFLHRALKSSVQDLLSFLPVSAPFLVGFDRRMKTFFLILPFFFEWDFTQYVVGWSQTPGSLPDSASSLLGSRSLGLSGFGISYWNGTGHHVVSD